MSDDGIRPQTAVAGAPGPAGSRSAAERTRAGRARLVARAAWDRPVASEATVLFAAADEAVLTRDLVSARVPQSGPQADPARLAVLLGQAQSRADQVAIALAVHGTGDAPAVRAAIGGSLHDAVTALTNHVLAQPDVDPAMLAGAVEARWGTPALTAHQLQQGGVCSTGNPPGGGHQGQWMPARAGRGRGQEGEPEEEAVNWGELRIEEPARPLLLPARIRSRIAVASDTGVLPRRITRWCTDRKVFAPPRGQVAGGTILIDVSGSMGLCGPEVLQILQNAPASTVAIYAGDGSRGVLRIIARDGRRTRDSALDLPMVGNVVDGPALRWLAGQARPRLWVCDGVVTGVGDCTSPALDADAGMLTQRADITRAGSVQELLDHMGAWR